MKARILKKRIRAKYFKHESFAHIFKTYLNTTYYAFPLTSTWINHLSRDYSGDLLKIGWQEISPQIAKQKLGNNIEL